MSMYFTHPELGHEIESIAGVYAYTDEKIIQVAGRDILYFIGYSVTNKSCCGVGGCIFATVAGFIKKYAIRKDEEKIISEVEPVEDENTRHQIEKILKAQGVLQVNFIQANR